MYVAEKPRKRFKSRKTIRVTMKIIGEAEKAFVWSAIDVLIATIVANFIEPIIEPAATIGTQSMLETLIRLDGILFGFTAVMMGLFIGKSERPSAVSFYRTIMYALISFWSYIFSILGAFVGIYLDDSLFWPVILTLFGAAHSSIYIVLVAFQEKLGAKKQK